MFKIPTPKIIILNMSQKEDIKLSTLLKTVSPKLTIKSNPKKLLVTLLEKIYLKQVLNIGKLTIKIKWLNLCQRRKHKTGMLLEQGHNQSIKYKELPRINHTKTVHI